MMARRLLAALVLFVLAVLVSGAGNQGPRRVLLYVGDTDSTEQASRWIPIQGANRIVIRTFSSKAAWSFTTDADSTFSDSIAGWRLLFSDSIGTTTSGIFFSGNTSYAADSIVLVATTDTVFSQIGMSGAPINKVLRAPANGSGIMTYVYPIQPLSLLADPAGVIGKSYMRVRFTPLRRSTVGGTSSTTGKRVVGLKGLKMEALIYSN